MDVRDVADAHLNAILVPEARNKRFMLSKECMWLHEIAAIIKKQYGKDYKMTDKVMPYWIIKVASFFSNYCHYLAQNWETEFTYDNQETKQILGVQFRDLDSSLLEMAETLIQSGYIPDQRK